MTQIALPAGVTFTRCLAVIGDSILFSGFGGLGKVYHLEVPW